MVRVQVALVSVSDKTGIVAFARALAKAGVKIISTGGTARTLSEAGVPVTPVDEITGFPEMLGGRVKTLHPKIHGGILAIRDNETHRKELAAAGIDTIDLVVVNLYPFRQTVANPNVSLDTAVENIDIGGPTMLRSAAKNYRYVGVVTDPLDYGPVLAEIVDTGGLSDETRSGLAAKAFRHTADYDAAIDVFLSKRLLGEDVLRLSYARGTELRYGENWHQKAMVFRERQAAHPGLTDAEQLWGKQLSYNNYLDLTAAVAAVRDLAPAVAVSVIKHSNPCGLATGKTIELALRAAWDGDRISAFGSVIACTAPFADGAAAFLADKMVECIIAPDFTPVALDKLKQHKNIMLLRLDVAAAGSVDEPVYRQVLGGMLRQDKDAGLFEKWEVVTKAGFPGGKGDLARFAMHACKFTKSNAIVLAREYAPGFFQVLGMGAGQPNRVDSLRKLAATKARENLETAFGETAPGGDREAWIGTQMAEAVLASDAFFPFGDTVREAASVGIRYIVQPGGSLRDQESIDAADELGIAMALTGMRHFLH